MFKFMSKENKNKKVNTCGPDGCCGEACEDCPCQNGGVCLHDAEQTTCNTCGDTGCDDCEGGVCDVCEHDSCAGVCGCDSCDIGDDTDSCACCGDEEMAYDGVNANAEVGEPIADFVIDAYHDGKIQNGFLSDFAGKWVVLFFYPADFSFVCPTELEELAGLYKKFQAIDTEILAISTDTAYAHKAWHDTSAAVGKVQFPMVSDASHELSEYFNVLLKDEGVSLRGTFIIDPNGVLVSAEINNNSIGRNANEILRKVQAAQFVAKNDGMVCPASWQEGDKGMEPGDDLVGKI